VVVFLIWLSWNVNAIFFGGALATEVELALHIRRTPVQMPLEVLTGLADQEAEPAVKLDNLDQL